MPTAVETAAARHFSPEGAAPVPLQVPDAVMPLACAAEFDTVYVGVTAFTYIVRAARHVVRNGFDETGFPVTESPATPEAMSAVELLAARSAVLGTL